MIKAEVIIVGAGPAGAACARHLVQKGVNCLILDKDEFPRSKLCAGWISPEVFKLLKIDPSRYPYGLTKFEKFQVSVSGIKINLRVHQFAIRRIEFDNWLLKESHAPIEKHHVKIIRKTKFGYEIDGKYRCDYLIGAGGTNSPVYRSIFQKYHPREENKLIVAMEEEFPYANSNGLCRLWFFEDGLPGYAWYVPKAENYLNVGIGGNYNNMKSKGTSIKEYWQFFLSRLEKEGLVRDHAFQPSGHSYFLRQGTPTPRIGNTLLVGDALGLATRDMGEGIRAAIQSGMLAARAIIDQRLYSISAIPRYSIPAILFSRFNK
jgi:flavin-dependent dehydrogenase